MLGIQALPDGADGGSGRGVREAAERRAINSTIQGSAADVIKVAMVNWAALAADKWPAQQPGIGLGAEVAGDGDGRGHAPTAAAAAAAAEATELRIPPGGAAPQSVELLAQIHDELLFECQEWALHDAVRAVRLTMEGAWSLDVPLLVKIQVGRSWGDMEDYVGG